MPNYGPLFKLLSSGCVQSITNALTQLDLTAAQGHIMGYLTHQDSPPCARDIEEHFQLSHPTVSGLLTRLEKKEFIELREDPQDRRIRRVYVLPKGLAGDDLIRQTIQENEARIVRDFTEEEKTQFLDFLARAAKNMGMDPKSMYHKEEKQE